MPRRQERGLRRIESILDAAEEVIGEAGYDAASMALIASRADISPGSLYQFFANKAELVEALSQRHVDHLSATEGLFDPSWPTLPIPQLVDFVVDPIIAFNLTHPAAKELLALGDQELATPSRSLHASLCDRVESLISEVFPHRSARDQHLMATTSIQIFSAMLPSVLSSNGRERTRTICEMKIVLVGYWERVASFAETSASD